MSEKTEGAEPVAMKICSNRGCSEPAVSVYVTTRVGRGGLVKARYPRCEKHPLGSAKEVHAILASQEQSDESG